MTRKNQSELAYLFATTSFSLMLAACGGSSGSSGTPVNPPAALADPQNVQVVSGDGDSSEVQNTISWTEQAKPLNNDLNDITWDGSQFVVVGSNDTILTSPDGLTWASHVPGTSDINFVAVTHWDSGLPQNPVPGTVGSSGTYVVGPDADPGTIIRTGTTEQLGGMTWVDDGNASAYFVIVGNDGTVLTAQHE